MFDQVVGYIALLDVLGFSAFIRDNPDGKELGRYLNCVKNATTRGLDYLVFSDSITITSRGDGPEPLLALAGACSYLFWSLLDARIPVRGAIAFGTYFRSTLEQSVFIAGPAVVDAYQFEKSQDWVGIMLAPSALSRVQDLEARCKLTANTRAEAQDVLAQLPWPAVLQPCNNIPFHTSSVSESTGFDGVAVVPTNRGRGTDEVLGSIRAALVQLQWLRKLAPNPASQQKYRATIDWLRDIENRWNNVRKGTIGDAS